MKAKFCGQCGAPLEPNVRFCTQCGSPVTSSPVAPVPAPQPVPYPTEPILDIIPALQRRKGMLGMRADTVNLILTPARLVFVPVTSQEMREAVRVAHAEAKAQGRGMFGQMAAQMAWVDVVCNHYRSMPIDAVLAQHPGSFFILHNQVSRIRFRETASDDDATSGEEMIIESTGGKHRFDLSRVSGGDVRQRLRQVLPHAVR